LHRSSKRQGSWACDEAAFAEYSFSLADHSFKFAVYSYFDIMAAPWLCENKKAYGFVKL